MVLSHPTKTRPKGPKDRRPPTKRRVVKKSSSNSKSGTEKKTPITARKKAFLIRRFSNL